MNLMYKMSITKTVLIVLTIALAVYDKLRIIFHQTVNIVLFDY